LYPFPPREQLLAAVVLGPGVVAVSGVVMVLRLRRRYNADKTYYEENQLVKQNNKKYNKKNTYK
jgi:hypothetical protein